MVVEWTDTEPRDHIGATVRFAHNGDGGLHGVFVGAECVEMDKDGVDGLSFVFGNKHGDFLVGGHRDSRRVNPYHPVVFLRNVDGIVGTAVAYIKMSWSYRIGMWLKKVVVEGEVSDVLYVCFGRSAVWLLPLSARGGGACIAFR